MSQKCVFCKERNYDFEIAHYVQKTAPEPSEGGDEWVKVRFPQCCAPCAINALRRLADAIEENADEETEGE